MHQIRQRMIRRGSRALMAAMGLALIAAGCSSGSSTSTSTASSSPSNGAASSAPASTSTSSEPGAMFSTKDVGKVGTVVVDGRGRTVYVLTADGTTSAPCPDDNGCTKAWPDITVPDGTAKPAAGSGVDASLLGSKQVGDEQYATYNNWLLYEFAGDGAPGQANGEGIKSFGGTWYALDASGNLVMPGGSGATSTSSAGTTGGGAYPG